MVEHKFKIGDSVKLNPAYINTFPQHTKIGKIVGVDCGYILVMYVGCGYIEGFPYHPDEVKHAVRVGEQLLFSFMSKGD